MEAVDSGNRQSGHFSATQTEQQQRQPEYPQQPYHHSSYSRESLDRSYRDPAAMATATLLTPSTHYPPQTSSYSGYPHHAAGGSISSMISSVEPRKTVDDNDAASRQSLPSISEVISGTKPGYPPAPSLPSPFPPGTRAYPEVERHASPQPLHQSSYPPRQDAPSTYSESPRTGYSSRPPLPPVGTDRRASPSSRSDLSSQHRLPDQQNAPEPHLNGVYGHPIPPPLSYQTTPLPPGQMPLPAYPVSPRHSIPSHNPFEPRPPPLGEEFDFGNRTRYDATVNRHFESWNYQDALSRIGTSARTIYNFAEAYSRIALEQHQAHTIPERLPTEREVGDMIGNVEHLKRSLEQVRDVVMASIQNERAREGAKMKSPYDDEHDMPMYGDSMKPQYGMTEVKKRRGRAAPPGRCHSCNRIDTPEWRRGPDGARTLCNACGLHYAKLERKRQMEARSIRPKPEETLRP